MDLEPRTNGWNLYYQKNPTYGLDPADVQSRDKLIKNYKQSLLWSKQVLAEERENKEKGHKPKQGRLPILFLSEEERKLQKEEEKKELAKKREQNTNIVLFIMILFLMMMFMYYYYLSVKIIPKNTEVSFPVEKNQIETKDVEANNSFMDKMKKASYNLINFSNLMSYPNKEERVEVLSKIETPSIVEEKIVEPKLSESYHLIEPSFSPQIVRAPLMS